MRFINSILVLVVVVTLVDASSPPSLMSDCRGAVRLYIQRDKGEQFSSLKKAATKAAYDLAEARRCAVHPPETKEERAIDPERYYEEYCPSLVKKAEETLAQSTQRLNLFRVESLNLASHLLGICWNAANDEATSAEGSLTGIEVLDTHFILLKVTATEVVHHVYEDYASHAVAHFLSWFEGIARRCYSLYLKITQRGFITPPKTDPKDTCATATSSNSPAVTLSTIARGLLPDKLVWSFQLIGLFVAPCFVLGTIGTMLTIMLPALCGYLVFGEVGVFWLRVMFSEGYLRGLLNVYANSYGEVVRVVWSEHALEVIGYSAASVLVMFTVALFAYPWYSTVWMLIPYQQRNGSRRHA